MRGGTCGYAWGSRAHGTALCAVDCSIERIARAAPGAVRLTRVTGRSAVQSLLSDMEMAGNALIVRAISGGLSWCLGCVATTATRRGPVGFRRPLARPIRMF